MVFGSGKRAQARELKGKVEGILSLLDSLAAGSEVSGKTGENAKGAEGESVLATVNSLKDSIGQMMQLMAEISSLQQGLLGEYEKFVERCEGIDDLSRDGRYQLASDFFSFVVAKNAKNRNAADALQQDLAGLSEELDKLASPMQSRALVAGAGVSNDVEKIRQAVSDLASFLSVDIAEPSSKSGE